MSTASTKTFIPKPPSGSRYVEQWPFLHIGHKWKCVCVCVYVYVCVFMSACVCICMYTSQCFAHHNTLSRNKLGFFFLSQKRPLSQGNNCDCCGNSDLQYKTPCWGARLHGAIGGEPGSLKQWQRMGSGREWEREVGRQCRDRAYTCVLGTQTHLHLCIASGSYTVLSPWPLFLFP